MSWNLLKLKSTKTEPSKAQLAKGESLHEEPDEELPQYKPIQQNPKYQRKVEKWKRKVGQSCFEIHKVLPALRSGLDFQDKCRIIQCVREYAFYNEGGVERVETQLERAGSHQLAQVFRCEVLQKKQQNGPELGWCEEVVKMDFKGRWLAQREIYIKEMRALEISLEQSQDPRKKSSLDAYEKELQKLQDKYWHHDREMWKLDADMPVGSLRRAFQAWRKDPNWYLTPWLRQDCAGRGGCCGRDCGCCEKPRGTAHYGLHKGHCTSACSCCVRNGGGGGSYSTETSDISRFPFSFRFSIGMYSLRTLRAYIFGIDFLNDLD